MHGQVQSTTQLLHNEQGLSGLSKGGGACPCGPRGILPALNLALRSRQQQDAELKALVRTSVSFSSAPTGIDKDIHNHYTALFSSIWPLESPLKQ